MLQKVFWAILCFHSFSGFLPLRQFSYLTFCMRLFPRGSHIHFRVLPPSNVAFLCVCLEHPCVLFSSRLSPRKRFRVSFSFLRKRRFLFNCTLDHAAFFALYHP